MSEVTVTIAVDVNPTEDPEKVKAAIENLFAPSSLELITKDGGNRFVAKVTGQDGLAKFYALLRQEQILSAARRVLTRGTDDGKIFVYLNKQAAYMKRISFCEPSGESPLGPISVEIAADEPRALIDWLTPRQTD